MNSPEDFDHVVWQMHVDEAPGWAESGDWCETARCIQRAWIIIESAIIDDIEIPDSVYEEMGRTLHVLADMLHLYADDIPKRIKAEMPKT